MARPKTGREKPISVRIPKPLLNRIKVVAKVLAMSDVEVIRIATSIGLEQLRRVNYDLAGAILDQAAAQAEPDLRIAEGDEPGKK